MGAKIVLSRDRGHFIKGSLSLDSVGVACRHRPFELAGGTARIGRRQGGECGEAM